MRIPGHPCVVVLAFVISACGPAGRDPGGNGAPDAGTDPDSGGGGGGDGSVGQT